MVLKRPPQVYHSRVRVVRDRLEPASISVQHHGGGSKGNEATGAQRIEERQRGLCGCCSASLAACSYERTCAAASTALAWHGSTIQSGRMEKLCSRQVLSLTVTTSFAPKPGNQVGSFTICACRKSWLRHLERQRPGKGLEKQLVPLFCGAARAEPRPQCFMQRLRTCWSCPLQVGACWRVVVMVFTASYPPSTPTTTIGPPESPVVTHPDPATCALVQHVPYPRQPLAAIH